MRKKHFEGKKKRKNAFECEGDGMVLTKFFWFLVVYL